MSGGGLLVLGMHRSGTSATAGALASAGFHMGSHLIDGAEDNPQGYFEHAGVVAVHESLLEALDRAWDDVRDLPAGWEQGDSACQARLRLEGLLAEDLAPRAPWVVKDPRLCRLLPLWTPFLESDGAVGSALLVLRHPDEVAASLARRDRMPAEVAHLLWLRHVLEAEAGTRALRRACLDYEAILGNAQETLSRALKDCGVQAPRPLARAARHVTSRARHEAARTGADSPWRRLARKVHEAATGGDDPFTAIADAADAFEELLEQHAGWIATTGAVQAAARGATNRWRGRAIAAEGRSERLQAGLDEAGALSVSRLAELRDLDERLTRTACALQQAEELVSRHAADSRGLAEALARMESAKKVAEQLVEARSDEAAEAVRRSRRAEAAKALAEQLLHEAIEARQADEKARTTAERLLDEARAEVAALTAQVRAADEARAEAERLLGEARAEAAALTARVRAADEARAEAERLLGEARTDASALLAQVQAGERSRAWIESLLAEARAHTVELERRVGEEAGARAAVEALTLERLRELERLDSALRATAEAQERAEQLAYARQAALLALESGLAELAARLDALQGVVERDRSSDGEPRSSPGDKDGGGEIDLREMLRVSGPAEAAMAPARDALALALARTRQLEREVQTLQASAWWRVGRIFRALRGWLRRP